MLVNPAIGGEHHQRCEISPNQESLFRHGGGECDGSVRGFENSSRHD